MILNNIGHVYNELGNYLQSIKYHRKAFRIQKKFSTKNDIEFATTFNNLGVAYSCLRDTFNNIGEIYLSNGHSYEARINLEKALEIRLKSLPTDHPTLSASYSNLDCAYDRMATTYNNMAECYSELDDLALALFYHKKTLKIRLKSLSNDHPDIINSYSNIGSLYTDEQKYKLALKYLKKAISKSSSATITKNYWLVYVLT
ncbi:unnamed protein product [Rotaria sp. Silwood2]|nr:unnamed protein product [Rotaria sp. Silwood2]